MRDATTSSAKCYARKKAFGNVLIATLTVLMVLITFESITFTKTRQQESEFVRHNLAEFASRLSLTLNNNLNLTRGISTFIAVNPDLSQDEFAAFSKQLLKQNSQIRNIGAAKDLVVSHVYPLKDNESILGLDYRKNQEQRDAALKAIAVNKIIIAGPLELIQGGNAFIARTPVINANSGEVWGILSVVLDYDLFMQISTSTTNGKLKLAIKGQNAAADSGSFFYGNADIIHEKPISWPISLPHGGWIVYATPLNGWSNYTATAPAWVFALFVLILWYVAVAHRYKSELLLIESNEAIAESEQKFRNIFRHHDAVMLLINADDGRIIDANHAALSFYGYHYDDITGKHIQDINQLNSEEIRQKVQSASNNQDNVFIFPHKLANGKIRFVEVHSSPVKIDDDTLLFSIVHDITSRIESEQKLRLNAKVFEHSQEGVLVTDTENKIITVNKAFCDITGYEADDVIGQDPSILKSGRHDAAYYCNMYVEIDKNGFWKGEIWNRRKDGTVYPQLLSISPVEDEKGSTSHYVAVFSDITRLKQSEARMEHLAHYDALTGLPNRLLLRSRIEHAVEKQKHHPDEKVALLFLDLDHFKMINDSLGHPVGDLLLKQVAQRLSSSLREQDTVARLGGDEFVILLEGITRITDVNLIAQKTIELIKQPYLLDNQHEAVIGTSIGITLYPDDATDLDKLLTNADAAMYRAKQNGRNTYAFYTEAISIEAEKKLRRSNELRKALSNDELVLYYQPQIDIATGKICGAEALIRWQHPTEGLLTPWAFIGIAEETGLIHEVSKWVIQTGCQQLKKWQQKGLGLTLSLNVSPKDFRYLDFHQFIQQEIEKHQLMANELELELTENGLMETTDSVMDMLLKLKQLGLSLAVDDFGTGHSSIAYLKHFPVDKLKIDRSFVKELDQNLADQKITETIVDMAKNFELKVVAEGIETQAQQDIITRLDCDIAQGYLYSKPIPIDEFERLLKIPNKKKVAVVL